MTHAVRWSLAALREATLFEQSAGSVRVRAAQDRIDWALRRTPRDMGESRNPGYRLWYEDVLGMFYRIDEIAMTVDVLFCGPARRH